MTGESFQLSSAGSFSSVDARKQVTDFIAATLDRIALPKVNVEKISYSYFQITRLIAAKFTRYDDFHYLLRAVGALKNGRYPLNTESPSADLEQVNAKLERRAKKMKKQKIVIKEKSRWDNLFGRFSLIFWQVDGASIPRLSELMGFGEVTIAHDKTIAALSKKTDQSSRAAFLGNLAKEIISDFQTTLQSMFATKAQARYHQDAPWDIRIGYKQNVLRIW